MYCKIRKWITVYKGLGNFWQTQKTEKFLCFMSGKKHTCIIYSTILNCTLNNNKDCGKNNNVKEAYKEEEVFFRLYCACVFELSLDSGQ